MKKYHKFYLHAPSLDKFNDRLQDGLDKLPPDATLEFVNYDSHPIHKDTFETTIASVLIIYSTPYIF